MPQIPSRLEHLRAVVRRHQRCELDLQPDSLSCLGEFFAEHVTTQPWTAAEIERERAKLPEQLREVIGVDDWELTYETLSLCFDVGIYFAETLRRVHPELEWVLWKRKTIEYHRPVLDFSGGALDAPRIMNNVALKPADGTSKPNELRDLFDVWEGTQPR